MCDISKKSKFKTKTVYKAVVLCSDGTYLSAFAGAPLAVGLVPNFRKDQLRYSGWFNPSHPLHGKISGFAQKQDALKLSEADYLLSHPIRVLKIKLGGTILVGSTKGIDSQLIPPNHITYAGTEILSMEEIS